MIRPTAAAVVYPCVAPTDLRKQAASLALLVEQSLKRNIFEAALYVFSNARRDRIRILYWERNGLVLWSKRLEQQRFIWPRMSDADTVSGPHPFRWTVSNLSFRPLIPIYRIPQRSLPPRAAEAPMVFSSRRSSAATECNRAGAVIVHDPWAVLATAHDGSWRLCALRPLPVDTIADGNYSRPNAPARLDEHLTK